MNRLGEDDAELPQEDNLDEDDNALDEIETGGDQEDPLLLAIDDLEGRVVAALDEVKLHSGVHDPSSGTASIHEELSTLLRPVLEVAAHTGPSVARTYASSGLDDAVEDVYERVLSDLVLPVLLETAQSDQTAAKRIAALEFFRSFWKEVQKAGSWLDGTAPVTSSTAGPYGSGNTRSSSHHQNRGPPLPRPLQVRRSEKRSAHESEILRYWLQAAIACLTPGVFTSQAADDATSSRGVLAASASLRPSLKHIIQRIKAADDRGANRLYTPVMKLTENVLHKLLLAPDTSGGATPDNLLASCIKYVEIVVLCCSRKPQEPATRRRGASTTPQQDFSLEDLPEGHPVITRESLESIADYAFTVLRGFTLTGGQVKIDSNVLSSVMMMSASPSEQVVNILKPAALAYLELETNFPPLQNRSDESSIDLETNLDRSSIEYDFRMGPKPYSVAVNSLSALATHRPGFFRDAAICLARRAFHPPNADEGANLLTPVAIKAITSQIKSSCLTLLRNALSVSSNSSAILQKALLTFDMKAQADKALAMAKQAHSLKTAGRKERNRANIYYEWETTTTGTKRQRETDDALAKMRAAKAAKGLGHGIQLPTSMSDAVDLVLANLQNLPSKRPTGGVSKRPNSAPVTLEFVVDAVTSNGASLSQEEGRWYERDGGNAWDIELEDEENKFRPKPKLRELMDLVTRDDPSDSEEIQKKRKLYTEQSLSAAADAFGRILTNSANSRSDALREFGCSVAARLAYTLRNVKPMAKNSASLEFANLSVAKVVHDSDHKQKLEDFVDLYPLAATGLALDSETPLPDHASPTEGNTSIAVRFLNEALVQQDAGQDDPYFHNLYDNSLDLHISSVVNASIAANDKPNDLVKKKIASQTVIGLQRDIPMLPRLNQASIVQLATLCDIEEITKKAAQMSKKSSQESVAEAAAVHASKVAAEKRATATLLILRDVAFQRDADDRGLAVECAVGLASGRLRSTQSIQDKALKLVMNILYPRNEALAKSVADAATAEIELAVEDAVSCYDDIQKANSTSISSSDGGHKNALAPLSDAEKEAMDRMSKPVKLYMALCIRRTDMIKTLFNAGSTEKADVLSKTVRANMRILGRTAATKHGAASIAFDVASMTTNEEIPLLLSFLENLSGNPDQELIEACFKIQETRSVDGKKDPRYIIPVLPAMSRSDLVGHLPGFVLAEDKVFLDALVRMGSRVSRQALLFREEPEDAQNTLYGLTLTEQLVYLHKLDFSGKGIPQKRYLNAIKLCLEEDQTFNDRVVQSALDEISGTFLVGSEKLPLAFMRTTILVVTKHESLHTWISQVLLPRLVDGRIYEDSRQWEGWMRAAHILEKSGDSGVRAQDAISKLPAEQLMQYQQKW
eukprot:CAMPEP_0168720692 /NCGR_PEP_ID=MMETSP0724-20121128/1697_1 /TAXON_ID=265536 /ORGANISM="Amphiprora sp., Strain CCMP467" /LENGTH=1371 /DNA_ID=CAMNT_0008767309 /DNA_START=128 /DNA_END=4240 /DNA_ORIENTATION=+